VRSGTILGGPPRLLIGIDGAGTHLRFIFVLRVAWTLADLAGRALPGPDEVAEALGMRLQRVAV
jgi:hypothetical protein